MRKKDHHPIGNTKILINFHAHSGSGGECLNKYADIESGVAQGSGQVRPMVGQDAA
jgi:hypothetical protein